MGIFLPITSYLQQRLTYKARTYDDL